jgi:PHP family Zn ribbon phosphoesterase
MFPCDRLSGIDKRYRDNFRMSEIENLQRIRDDGIEAFLKAEEARWRCPKCGGVISCHNGLCFGCDLDRLRKKKRPYQWDKEPVKHKQK